MHLCWTRHESRDKIFLIVVKIIVFAKCEAFSCWENLQHRVNVCELCGAYYVPRLNSIRFVDLKCALDMRVLVSSYTARNALHGQVIFVSHLKYTNVYFLQNISQNRIIELFF